MDVQGSAAPGSSSASGSKDQAAFASILRRGFIRYEATYGSLKRPSPGSRECRICLQAEKGDVLLAPCACKGSLQFVHASCLQQWATQKVGTGGVRVLAARQPLLGLHLPAWGGRLAGVGGGHPWRAVVLGPRVLGPRPPPTHSLPCWRGGSAALALRHACAGVAGVRTVHRGFHAAARTARAAERSHR